MTETPTAILVPDYLTVRELAQLIDSSPIDVMKRLISNGIMASINQQIDFDTAAIVIEEMGLKRAIRPRCRRGARKKRNALKNAKKNGA